MSGRQPKRLHGKRRPPNRRPSRPSENAPTEISGQEEGTETGDLDTAVATGPLLELTISSVAYGGKGVARQLATDSGTAETLATMAPEPPSDDSEDDPAPGPNWEPPSNTPASQDRGGKVWFVEGAVTGDHIRARVTSDEGRYGEAAMVEVLSPSPLRQAALCPYEKECGGCQWMGIGYDQQLEWKRGFVESALKRIGKLEDEIPVSIIPSPSRYNYRNRILLRAHWIPSDLDLESKDTAPPNTMKLGYFARGSRRLVPITRCEIAAGPINLLLQELNTWSFPSMPLFKARLEIQEIRDLSPQDSPSAAAVSPKVVVTVYPAEGPRDAMDTLVARLKTLPSVAWAGLVFELSSAPLVGFDRDLDRDFFTIPGQFQQINLELNRTLRRIVRDKVERENPSRILDVFCGSGNLSLPLANGKRYVEAVEFNKKAIVCAHRHEEHNKLTNTCFIAGDAEKHLWKVARAGEPFDLVILDPPRQGVYKGMVPLKILSPKHIIYVSCDPTTLARDLGYLLRKDAYKIEAVTALDFFPNTYHVETVVFLKRGDL